MTIRTTKRTTLADTTTPVNLYLKLRDRFPGAVLLESSDYRASYNSVSYLALSPAAEIVISSTEAVRRYADGTEIRSPITAPGHAATALQTFADSLQWSEDAPKARLLGYISYDAVPLFETVSIRQSAGIPLIRYAAYRFVIEIHHFNNELTLYHNQFDGDQMTNASLSDLERAIRSETFSEYEFECTSVESANMSDEEYRRLVERGIAHCHRGDVFQIVLSRRFDIGFSGDEFNVYRALRSVNPSPYLFFFDYGEYTLFGSSPEAQLVIDNGKASIRPIAGTYRRDGVSRSDADLVRQLLADEKENAEHVMLVDLARNDLSRYGTNVTVEAFREVQFYSHVIHLVSDVTSSVSSDVNLWDIVGGCFPAGTLSGAPKYRAMQLIDEYEPTPRGFYGGCVGWVGPNGTFNHAIMIRSFCSRRNTLTYQAGAGVVAHSDPESERQEVDNKLGALRRALRMAEEL